MGSRRVASVLADPESRFYGDYDFDMYIGTRNDYPNLEAVVAKVIRGGGGWVCGCRIEEGRDGTNQYTNLGTILAEFCWLSHKGQQRLLPRKETGMLSRALVLRHDGNFKMIAVETPHLYYVFCFATS